MAIDLDIIEELAEDISAFRRDLADNPEVGPDVSRTAGKVVEKLQQTS